MRIAVVYTTRHGQTRRVAERLAGALSARGAEAEAVDVTAGEAERALDGSAAVVLAAAVHFGRHERAMIDFVRRRRAAIARRPNAFVSVSLSAATMARATSTPDQRARAAADVRRALDGFVRATGWQPERLWPVAGALAYTKYNPLVRWMMRLIARRTGAGTDTSRDHEFTDWEALDRRADELYAAATHAAGAP